MSSWYLEENANKSVVYTSVRLLRNVEGFPFSKNISFSEQQEINSAVKSIIFNSNTPYAKNMKYISMENVPLPEAYAMAERNVITENFLHINGNKAVIISEDEKISIMLGGEDHICIQVLSEGLNLNEAYNAAYGVDYLISSGIRYAFDGKLGYLTANPTNLGTGLQAEALMHLYALQTNNAVKNIGNSISKIGFNLNAAFNGGNGAFYRITNSISLGITEKNAIDNLYVLISQISEKEELERKALNGLYLQNAVWRSYGILKNARLLTNEETINLLSEIKLGTSLGIINISETLPIKLITECQPYMLCRKYGTKTEEELNVLRANTVRRDIPTLEE